MKTGDRGQVLVVVAVAFVALLGFAALAVDVAYMYTVRHELQRCADAGALAGASIFREPGGSTWPPDVFVVLGTNLRARTFAAYNKVSASPPSLNFLFEVDVSIPSQNRIHVGTHRTVNLFFARIFGMNSTTINAYAEAEAVATGPGTIILRLVK